jgi:hypothetical protein
MRGFTQWLFPEEGHCSGSDRSEGKHIWLVYGTRHESELYYRDYFERLAEEHENFHYVTTLSRAHEEWSGKPRLCPGASGPIVETRGGPGRSLQQMPR